MGKRITWLSILQGWSMLLVVIGHISLTNIPNDPSTPIATLIERLIYSFHMPLFMVISGWLFYYTCLGKNKPYNRVLKSKFTRLGVPFLFFTIVTTGLKVVFAPLMNRQVDCDELINTFIFFRSNPLGEMWFIITLLVLMVLYPVYKYLIKSHFNAILGLIIGIVLYYLFPKDITYFQLNRVAGMFIFFYSGILCCKYNIVSILNSHIALLISLFAFAMLTTFPNITPPMQLLTKFTGIVFSFALCLCLSSKFPTLFSSFSKYTFQIFLTGIFFQMAIRWIYVYIGIEYLFIPFWIVSMIIGIYIPVVIAKTVESLPDKYSYIKRCVGL